MRSSLARFLIAVVLPVSCYGVTVTDRMVTKAVDTSGCTVPTPVTSFLTTDQKAWVWFNVTGAMVLARRSGIQIRHLESGGISRDLVF